MFKQSTILRAAVVALAMSAGACQASVDLDVTLFDTVDLDLEFAGNTDLLPPQAEALGETDDPSDGTTPGTSTDGESPEGEFPEGDFPEGEIPEGEIPEGEIPEGFPDPNEPYMIERMTTVDLTEDVDAEMLSSVDAIVLHELAYRVTENSMSVSLKDIKVFLGPGTALTAQDPGVIELVHVPMLTPGSQIDTIEVVLDPLTQQQLVAHLESMSLSMFIQTEVLIEGQTRPTGSGFVELDVRATLHSSGLL